MLENAIKFWSDKGEKKVQAVIKSDLAGAQLYHPKTEDYYQSNIGVLYWYSWEENRYIKFSGFIDLNQMIKIDDLKRLADSHRYMREYGDIDVAEASLRSLQVSALILEKTISDVRACQNGNIELTAQISSLQGCELPK